MEPPPKRTYTIWSFDVGKQLVGGAVAHGWNLILAASFAAATGAAVVSDECAFYALNFIADTFCGVFVTYALLTVQERLAREDCMDWPSLVTSGLYGDPPDSESSPSSLFPSNYIIT